jgi:hypothetical protein
MRLASLCLVGWLLLVFTGAASGQANDDLSASQRAETSRRFGLDPTSALDSRVRETPAAVLKMFEEDGLARPTPHVLTVGERRQLAAAFAALPPLHRRVLRERLLGVSFLDGMPNTALTSPINPDDPYRLFHITIRAAILHQNASEWLTEKERTCFAAAGSPLSVSIEAGKRDALVYVLLHEATHVVDASLGITPAFPRSSAPPSGGMPSTAFTDGIWSERIVPAPAYHDPLRERIRFRPGGATLPIDQSEAVYGSLRRTPFVSLYGSSNWYDDLAEYVAVYHWTQVLKQPFRIVLRQAGKKILVYEPMKSALVRGRIDQMQRFYAPQDFRSRPEP